MPCPEYEALIKNEWGPALREHDWLKDSPSKRQMSAKAHSEALSRARFKLEQADSHRNSHVAGCKVCQNKGKKSDWDSTHPSNF